MPRAKTYAGDRTCPVCGKQFVCYTVDMWVYKRTAGNHYYVFCSWSCMQKDRRQIEEARSQKQSRRGRRKKSEGYISKTEE